MSASTRNKHSKHNNNNKNEKLDISKDEFERISEALKNEEFRKLFFDYIDEIQDPENRKLYEEEIKQLEKERGVEVTFIHPKPGFVIKSAIDGEVKCFINIASSSEVERPHNEIAVNPQTGSRGLSWSIPMAQTAARDDFDAKNNHCKVYDVVFHPDALHLGTRDKQFRQCLIDTALDAVEREYGVHLDRANLKFPKLDYKGVSRPTVIRKLAKDPTAEEREPHPLEHMYPKKPEPGAGKPKVLPMKTKLTPKPTFTVPNYSIKHSHDVDLSEYTDELDAKLQATVPRALVVEIELPLLNSTADCQLDVTERSVYLLSERQGAKYRLKLDLPYTVDDKSGNARFDLERRRLCITLPVVRSTARQQRDMHDTLRLLSREDSGVELHSNSESPAEEEEEAEEQAKPKPKAIVELPEQGASDDEAAESSNPITAIVTPRTFLKTHLHYKLPPKFDCNALDALLAFVLHVPNVQPDSMETLQLERSVYVQFASMGSGYYPIYYAFHMQLPAEQQLAELRIEQVELDASDENVVMRLSMSASCELLTSYLAGLDAEQLKSYAMFKVHEVELELEQQAETLHVSMERNEQQLAVTIEPECKLEEEEEQQQQQQQAEHEQQQQQIKEQQQKKLNKKQRKRNKKQRSLSESACEELKEQREQQPPVVSSQPVATLKLPARKQRSYSECNESSGSAASSVQRGILKRFSRYGPRPSISDSCSSIDECCSYSCSIEGNAFSSSFGGIPEEDATLSESCKKTVRFNDHIMKQVFRHDSSILGQRKKNQKRRDCKLRAQQRRLSEGDSADYEETLPHAPAAEQTTANAQYFKQTKQQHQDNKENKKDSSLHDSGLDLTAGEDAKRKKKRLQQQAQQESMMFEMDDDI
ncbi:Nop17l [Drosophila busckii]|uniref:Protein kintoun n=1 Tax=Drosophila busckii TaxID=30019 RepID=A0A0M4EBD3_DROBS|nr:protein kintoun [Drosophila busckii]ALC40815.1 Nop17l [Drosophila busckii]